MTDDTPLLHLRQQALGGSPQALYVLATELVLRHEMEEAFELHRRAAETGLVEAQIEYARMLLYGIATTADPGQAVKWLERAETSRNPVASYLLTLIALGGVAMPRDGRVDERLLAIVRADYPPALLAAAIQFGRSQHERDQQLCMQLLERAAARGDSTAALLMAERLARGEGCVPQPEEAQYIYEQLARDGIDRLPAVSVPLAAMRDIGPGVLTLQDALLAPLGDNVSTRPRVSRVDSLLSADECRLLIARAQPRLRRSQTMDPDTGLPLTMQIRTSSDSSFDPVGEDLALRLVQLRMASAAGLPLVNAEHLTVLRYEPGQEYRPHRDYRPPGSIEHDQPQAGNRQRTICVYLNQPEAGGETEFPVAGVKVEASAGRAVIFDNLHADGSPDVDSLHAGLPVLRGEKWLATLWLRQGQYRAY